MQDAPEASAPIPAGQGRLVVYRTQALAGAVVQPAITINGAERGRCSPRGAFSVDLAPGQHIVGAATEVRQEAPVTVAAGQTSYLRCSVGMGLLVGRPRLEPVPASVGQQESAGLAFSRRN